MNVSLILICFRTVLVELVKEGKFNGIFRSEELCANVLLHFSQSNEMKAFLHVFPSRFSQAMEICGSSLLIPKLLHVIVYDSFAVKSTNYVKLVMEMEGPLLRNFSNYSFCALLSKLFSSNKGRRVSCVTECLFVS